MQMLQNPSPTYKESESSLSHIITRYQHHNFSYDTDRDIVGMTINSTVVAELGRGSGKLEAQHIE